MSLPVADANADVAVVESATRPGSGSATRTSRSPVGTATSLEYTLPDANVASGRLDLDIIGNDETLETKRFEVVLTGFEFDTLECVVGPATAVGDCRFDMAKRQPGGGDRALAPGEGITVSGTITALDEVGGAVDPRSAGSDPGWLPPARAADDPARARVAALRRSSVGRAGREQHGDRRRRGRGRVRRTAGARRSDVATSRCRDLSGSRLAARRTGDHRVRAARGLEPWQAAVVLREQVDDDTVAAWFSEMIADGAMVATEVDGAVRFERGPDTARLSAVDPGI